MKVDIIDKEFSELFDDHLSHLGELFYRVHTESAENMFSEPKHLSDGFIKKMILSHKRKQERI